MKMEFFDFEIRAWQIDQNHAQVLVHSSPVGDLLRPIITRIDWERLADFLQLFSDSTQYKNCDRKQIIEGGLLLSEILFPTPIYKLFIRSYERVGPENGLRIRLCVDEALIDLPWEYLYRPDTSDNTSLSGFLVLDSRISLVRLSPRYMRILRRSSRKKHLLYAGTHYYRNGLDVWNVDRGRDRISKGLTQLSDSLKFQSVSTVSDEFEKALAQRTDIFHYVGHTDEEDGQSFLLRDKDISLPTDEQNQWDRLYAHTLSKLLNRSKTRLAVFCACYSGRWSFVKPLIQAGIPVVIGTQGIVSTAGAYDFVEKLYKAMVIGLSLEEAVTWARLHLLEPDVSPNIDPMEWGIFMVYMPTSQGILFPRPVQKNVREQQEIARRERKQTIIIVNQTFGIVESGAQVTGVMQAKSGN
jgi:hypothetical protein